MRKERQAEWFVVLGSGEAQGPFSLSDLASRVIARERDATVLVWREGLATWAAPQDVEELARKLPPELPGVDARCAACSGRLLPGGRFCPFCGSAAQATTEPGTPRPAPVADDDGSAEVELPALPRRWTAVRVFGAATVVAAAFYFAAAVLVAATSISGGPRIGARFYGESLKDAAGVGALCGVLSMAGFTAYRRFFHRAGAR